LVVVSKFASTDDNKLAALVAAVEVEINEGKVLPMFDEYSNVVLDYDEYERLLK
jgi:hypothetical protein